MDSKSYEQILKEGRRIREELEQGYIATKLSRIDASLIGRKIKFQALIVGEQVGKACEQYIRVFCNKCGEQLQNVDLLAQENTQVLYEKLAVGKVSHSALSLIRNWGECKEGGTHEPRASLSIGECFDYSIIYVKELPENIETFSETEYQALTSKIWKVYYTGIPKEAKRIEVIAYPFKNPRNNEIEFLAREINPLSDEFASLKITKEDHLKFIQYFRDNPRFDLVIENQVAPHIVGRNFEKLSLLLTLHSPYEIFDIFNSRKIRGCLRTVWIGDTKTGKSEIGKDITYLFYKIGEIVFGETSSRAGLTYTIDTDSRTIIWGAIPLNDRKFLFIDGVHTITEEEIEQMREVLEQEIVKVSRSVSGERLARIRLIATLNPRNPPMRNYYYKLKALMDTRVFSDPIDLTRWDIFVPFTLEDVPGDLIAEAKPKERPIPVEIFKKHVLWAWSLDANKIRYSETAKERIVEFSKELYKWVSSNYPLIHAGVRDTLTRLSVAFACLHHSISEDLEYVEVKEEHVVKAKEFIEEMIQRIDYDAFMYRLRDQIEISDEEVEEIKQNLKESDIQILRELTSGPKSSPQLASVVGISATKLKENHYPVLRKFNLIETSQGFGAKITVKGILFLKKLDGKGTHCFPSSNLVTRSNPEKQEKKVTTGDYVTTSEKGGVSFLRLPEGYQGKCSYCGEDTFLEWIDSKGNHLCSNCRWEE